MTNARILREVDGFSLYYDHYYHKTWFHHAQTDLRSADETGLNADEIIAGVNDLSPQDFTLLARVAIAAAQ